MVNTFLRASGRFIKREAVLFAALLLAVISAFFVPPSAEYIEYIDWDTLALLFGLMAVMKGYQKAGLFSFLADKLLKHADTSKKLAALLVFLPFFLSMLITNDVALLTFVPFGIVVMRSAGAERQIIPLVVLQTIAANLGSMLTPLGNPQNLYLYNASGLTLGEFMLVMLPYTALAFVGLAAAVGCFRSVPVCYKAERKKVEGAYSLAWPTVFFAACVCALFDFLPPVVVALLLLVFLLITDRKTLARVDYSLLLTFAALFVFIGNMGNIAWFRSFLSSVLHGNEKPVAVLASQIISNVPAALLLSGFSSAWQPLIIGCNLGGLGTLIASMASLISYKEIAKVNTVKRSSYLIAFTVWNIAFLGVLLGASYLFDLFL